jgi:hypothetical protein
MLIMAVHRARTLRRDTRRWCEGSPASRESRRRRTYRSRVSLRAWRDKATKASVSSTSLTRRKLSNASTKQWARFRGRWASPNPRTSSRPNVHGQLTCLAVANTHPNRRFSADESCRSIEVEISARERPRLDDYERSRSRDHTRDDVGVRSGSRPFEMELSGFEPPTHLGTLERSRAVTRPFVLQCFGLYELLPFVRDRASSRSFCVRFVSLRVTGCIARQRLDRTLAAA